MGNLIKFDLKYFCLFIMDDDLQLVLIILILCSYEEKLKIMFEVKRISFVINISYIRKSMFIFWYKNLVFFLK